MKMQVNFYSKEEVSIQMDFSGRYPFPENEASELFLFICFTLRQLNNLGQHPATQALAGLLVHENSLRKLFQNIPELPEGKDLLSYLKQHAISAVSQKYGVEETYKVGLALYDELNHKKAILQALDAQIITKMPALVKYKGNGKKSFEVTLPPFLLHTKGFGILGTDIPHHAFHSVAGLIRVLGQKHIDNETYLDHLIKAAEVCGLAYILKNMPRDEVAMANAIIKELGIG